MFTNLSVFLVGLNLVQEVFLLWLSLKDNNSISGWDGIIIDLLDGVLNNLVFFSMQLLQFIEMMFKMMLSNSLSMKVLLQSFFLLMMEMMNFL